MCPAPDPLGPLYILAICWLAFEATFRHADDARRTGKIRIRIFWQHVACLLLLLPASTLVDIFYGSLLLTAKFSGALASFASAAAGLLLFTALAALFTRDILLVREATEEEGLWPSLRAFLSFFTGLFVLFAGLLIAAHSSALPEAITVTASGATVVFCALSACLYRRQIEMSGENAAAALRMTQFLPLSFPFIYGGVLLVGDFAKQLLAEKETHSGWWAQASESHMDYTITLSCQQLNLGALITANVIYFTALLFLVAAYCLLRRLVADGLRHIRQALYMFRKQM